MIGTVVIGKSFYHSISYLLEDKRTLTLEQKLERSQAEGLRHLNRAEILDYNNCFGNKYELASQFREVAQLSSRAEKPVMHLSLSLAPGEKLSRSQWLEAARDSVQQFKLENNQYLVVMHYDKKEQHIHILANRVGYDGRAVSDSHSYRKMAELCRRLEQKLALKRVLSPRLYLSREMRLVPRHDERKIRMKLDIRDTLLQSRNMEEFRLKMKQRGYCVEKSRGIAFTDEKKVRVKGSELGYSLQTIERILEQPLERRLELSRRMELKRQQQKSSPEILSMKQELQPKMKKENHPTVEKDHSLERDLHAAKILELLMEHNYQGKSLPYELTRDKKRRHRHRHDQGRGL